VKNLLEVSRYREEDKIKMENERTEWGGGVELINLAQDRDSCWAAVTAVIKLEISKNAGKF
jgi:hypothetical protein